MTSKNNFAKNLMGIKHEGKLIIKLGKGAWFSDRSPYLCCRGHYPHSGNPVARP